MSLYLGSTPIADGASTALLADKADVDLSNCTKPHIVETYVNGTSWYRVYSDGWCEQGGQSDIGTTVNLLKSFANTSYDLQVTTRTATAGTGYIISQRVGTYTTTSTFKCESQSGNSVAYNWVACGYIS